MAEGAEDRQHEDFKWFVGEMPELYAEHGRCYVTVSGKRVVAIHGTYRDAVRSARATMDIGTYIIQEVGPDESAYTFRMPRLVVGL